MPRDRTAQRTQCNPETNRHFYLLQSSNPIALHLCIANAEVKRIAILRDRA
jgi:hypothetical protein